MPTAEELGVESVQEVLEVQFGLEGNARGDEFDIHCPNPGHTDRRPSCAVNLHTGLWNCFSCGVAGDLLGLGVLVLDLPHDTKAQRTASREQVEQLVRPRTTEALLASVRRRLEALSRHPSATVAPPPLPAGYEPGPLTELRGRGFAQETLRRWDVQYLQEETLQGKKQPFTIRHSFAIPIKDADGRLLAWCYRRTADSPKWQPRYLYTPDAPISELWFGLQYHSRAKDIVVVEGALDAMWVDQCGFPALALLGSEMGQRKILSLQNYRTVTILGDFDAAGLMVVRRIGQLIGDRVPVRVARYARWMNAADPQELAPIDLEITLARATPWTSWLVSGLSTG